MKNRIIILVLLISSFLFAANFGNYDLFSAISENHVENKKSVAVVEAMEATPKAIKNAKVFSADIKEGFIGDKEESDVDDAYDNVFHLAVNVLPTVHESAYLEYDLYGYNQAASISRSLNNQASIGGQFLSKNSNWTPQSELLSEKSLRQGDNVLLFTAPEGSSSSYKVKNVRIVYKPAEISPTYTLLQSENKLYVKGTNFPSQIRKLTIAGIAINVNQSEFELVLDSKLLNSDQTISVYKETTTGIITNEKLKINNFLKVAHFRPLGNAKESVSKTIHFKMENKLEYNDFKADFSVGVLKSDLRVRVSGLRKIDIAPLNSAMVNVTAENAGFRLLPHGTVFDKAVRLSVPFDKKAIPEGYTEKDINVFYFDENKRLWQEVPKDSLDIKKGIIVAKTTHFTDFIAGIIKMPESPETSGYTPTSIKDLKAASPLVGIQSIAPPSANGRGTASTGFGIAIPSGRGGMQPSFNLQYDSDGGYSWTGTGWDVSVPAVSIETRWGAPRYDASQETESYAIAGKALIPNTHRAAWVNRTADKQFYPRREGAFQQIIRKGSSPKNYYWVVKDKSGVASYYGGTTSGLADNGILQDASGNIGHWALCLQVDLKGNTVQYEYDKRDGELYLKKVYYTGFGSEKGNYSVTFVKSGDLGEANRADVQVSARLGFKQLNNQLLRKIEVRYKSQMVRSYELNYKEGAFKKTLLKSISEYDSESKLFYTNTLDYFDDVRDASGKYNPFGEEQKWNIESDNLQNEIVPFLSVSGKHNLAGSSNGKSAGINYRVGVGFAINTGSFKENTVGAHGGNNWSSSETIVSLEDIDGDQLPDKVFVKDDKVYYRKNLSSQGINGFRKRQEISLNNIGNSSSKSFNWGVDLVVGGSDVGASVGYDEQYSKSKTKSYFMDFNGDGLVDFVNNGQVFYNRLENGIPTFRASSTGTPSPVSGGGALSLDFPNPGMTYEEMQVKNPLHDVVRVWEAPATGKIIVSHEYELLKDLSKERLEYLTNDGKDKADGVQLFFQKGNNNLIWKETLAADDYNSKTREDQITVKKGEKLFFRVSSIMDGSFDKVGWSPKISYTSINDYLGNPIEVANDAVDANLYSLKNYDADKDFLSSTNSGLLVPSGIISFGGIFNKPITSDHVTLRIFSKDLIGTSVETVLFEKQFLANELATFDLSSIGAINNATTSLIRFELNSQTNVNWNSISFNPSINLPAIGATASENKKVDVFLQRYKKRKGDYIIEKKISTVDGVLSIKLDDNDLNLLPVVGFNSLRSKLDGTIIISAKQNNQLVARKKYKMVDALLVEDTSNLEVVTSFATVLKDLPIDLEISVPALESNEVTNQCIALIGMPIYLTVQSEKDGQWKSDTNKYSIYAPFYEQELQLGLGHREWGGFVINNTGVFASDLIVESELKTADTYTTTPNVDPNNQSDAEQEGYDIAKVYFISMQSIYSKNKMIGLEETSFFDGKMIGTCRLGEDDIASYFDASSPDFIEAGGSTMALPILSENKSKSYSAGLKVGPLGPGGSKGSGSSYVTQTMSDFNGDRFPDYIRGKEVQFTSPIGGISDKKTEIYDYNHGESTSVGISSDGSYSHAYTKTVDKFIGRWDKGVFKINKVSQIEATGISAKMSLAGSVGTNEDESQYIHSDINGDGLVDRINKTGDVALNSGYGFLPEEKWNFEGIATGFSDNKSLSATGGISYKSGSFTGGFNYGTGTDNSSSLMIDINSDGLTDKIEYIGGEMKVAFNMGGSFMTPIVYPKFSRMNENKSTSYGINTGFSYDFPVFLVKITPSFGVSAGISTSRTEATFNDMDGDGNLDYILSTDEDNLTVRLSNIKRTNKLKGVTNAVGNSYVVDYELIKPTYENPNAKWVLQSVDVNDGHTGDGIDHSIAKFKYEDGYYDRREREFYGFGKIIQEQIDAADNTVFATTVQEFYNQDYFRKNLLKRSYTLDKNNRMRQESENEYSFTDVVTQASVPVASLGTAVCDAKRVFVGMIHSNQKMYEGGSEYLETNTFNTYDANGNITQYDDLGNGSADDKVTAKISYYESTTPYFGGIPKQLEVFTKDGLRRKRATTINTTTAEVTQIKNYSAADKIALTDIGYDTYGNLQKITGPANYKDQRMTMDYVYDSENHQFLTEIKDAFGYQNKMEYDYRFGIPLKTTDRNDQSTEYTIDAIGRPATIRGPYEIASGKPYTIAYDYFPTAKVPYAKTRNYDPELDKDIVTYTYTDGLGRALQVKKTASLFTQAGSPDQEAQIVSGKVIYDGLGRPTTSYYPTTTTTIDANFSAAVSNVTPTKTEYDEVGRAVKVTLPDGSTNATTFKIDNYNGVPTMLTTQTDALGKTVQSQTDVKGSNLASIQNDLVTKFDINALGETIQVTDAMDHITKSSYDWLGRRTEFTHPDAGTTTMEYDLAGNLTKRVTQDIKNTVPNGGAIQYLYDYNRLETIQYPKNPQNNVQYNYGKADGTASRRGRLWFVQDASGGQEFYYGKLGEVEKEIRTLRITPTDIQTYISQFEYDTWNRIQKMTYPDGEVVDYTYNRAGNLQSMQGKKESHTYDYIKQLAYDEFEQRKYLKYGNDTETNYNYDPTMRRLQQLQVSSSLGRQIMNNSYSYDLVGNVLGIKNVAPVVNNTLGGTSNHEYQYDNFYRLKSAKATYQGEFTKASYELNMSYNKMHNITKKDLVHTVNNEQKGYVLDYTYDNELHPNAPSSIQETAAQPTATSQQPRAYVYDGNGNPTSFTEEKSFRKMTWDEENRLMGINDNGRIHQYTYDAGGERVIKSSGDSQHIAVNGQTAATIVHTDDYTGYVSPYFVISKGKFTKHYFEGAGRIVSKLGNGAFAQPLKITAGGVNYTQRTAAEQKALDAYVQSLGVPPGPPTQQGIYATPEFTGDPYPSEVLQPVEENQEPPEGWPRNPIFNAPGDVPGPPVQFGPPVEPATVLAAEGFTGIGLPENDIFYFHPDHLGSTSYISTRNGSISQHVEYIAFGEILFEEHSSSFSSPYLFNGKELDRETNLSYYGARYLDMKTSLWLNVDPLALYNPIFEDEFYFDGQHNGGVYNSGNLAPYIYCYQNPVRFIDPNGKQTEVTNNGSIFNADKNSKIDPTVRGQNRVDEKSHIRVNASIYKNALSQKSEKNTTHIYSHGWYNKSKSGSFSYLSIYYEDQNKYYSIRNSNDLKSWLSSNGISSNFLNTKGQTLILHGCRSAYGENSVAQTLSKENPDLITVGATGNVAYNEKGEYVGTASNGTKDKGKWNVYKNGEVINSFPWDWKPNNKDVQKGIKNEQ